MLFLVLKAKMIKRLKLKNFPKTNSCKKRLFKILLLKHIYYINKPRLVFNINNFLLFKNPVLSKALFNKIFPNV